MTVSSLVAALRAGAEGLYALEAATGLVIAHGTWLARGDDSGRFIRHGAGTAAIDWEATIDALQAGRHRTRRRAREPRTGPGSGHGGRRMGGGGRVRCPGQIPGPGRRHHRPGSCHVVAAFTLEVDGGRSRTPHVVRLLALGSNRARVRPRSGKQRPGGPGKFDEKQWAETSESTQRCSIRWETSPPPPIRIMAAKSPLTRQRTTRLPGARWGGSMLPENSLSAGHLSMRQASQTSAS